MGLDFEATPEEIKIFLEEAKEQIQTLEDGIMSLEKEHGEIDPESLQSIFRAAHTLKGSSAALGHVNMAKLTHEMETILDHLRKKSIDVTPELVELLLDGIDGLRIFNDEIYQGKESGIDVNDLVLDLQNFVATALDITPDTPKKAPFHPDQTDLKGPLFDASLETAALEIATSLNQNVFEIEVRLNTENTLPPVRAYQVMMFLEDIGQLIASEPTLQDLEKDRIEDTLKVLLVTKTDKKAVEDGIASIPDCKKVTLTAIKKANKTEKKEKIISAKPSTDLARKGVKAEKRTRSSETVISPTIRVDVDVLDDLMNLVGELVIDRTRINSDIQKLHERKEAEEALEKLGQTGNHIGRVTEKLQELIMKARLLPLETLFRKFPRMVRDLALKAEKEVQLVMVGEDTEIDRSVIEQISDPLIHLLRNAIDHGIEKPEERARLNKNSTGTVCLSAEPEENYIVIRIKDDGKGIDPAKIAASAVKKGLITPQKVQSLSVKEATELVFMPGFSTAEEVTQVSGRGVGMDIVKKNLENLNGSIQVFTEVGKGTEFRIELPLTLAIMRTLLFQSTDNLYAIPLSAVAETNRISKAEIKYVDNRKAINLRGKVLPLIHIEELFNLPVPQISGDFYFVIVVKNAKGQVGIIVEKLLGEEEVVVKTLSKLLGETRGISGAAILGQGEVAFILDVPSLLAYVTDSRLAGACCN
ncbi:MAG: chemotaxis protein CheA [Firmicutes bacterium]|nr:chemotaxis protein CheA [Bacillota bacterium]